MRFLPLCASACTILDNRTDRHLATPQGTGPPRGLCRDVPTRRSGEKTGSQRPGPAPVALPMVPCRIPGPRLESRLRHSRHTSTISPLGPCTLLAIMCHVYFPLVLCIVRPGFTSRTPLLVGNAGARNVAMTAGGDEAVVPADEQVIGENQGEGWYNTLPHGQDMASDTS